VLYKSFLLIFVQCQNCERIQSTFYSSGAETILGQGGKDQERQSLEREIRFFVEIGLFFVPKTSVL